MTTPGNNKVHLIGGENQPVVLRSECIITPELKRHLEAWQSETGVHMATIGNVIYMLGIAALSKILNDTEQRKELDSEVQRIQEDGPPEG